ncbi:hypothetical protein H4Q32_019814 [Labeo rohita]|uniref:Reverse transcriptase domain-containing protein n=1 Tax=Labeo rohita TaxID=84645 RepID=A0ABQ8LPV9_LABRO|nr:hypothetical protein H4Q32_019814 [Labeo rohita]
MAQRQCPGPRKIQLDQLTCYRADRVVVAGGKTHGGGLCVYINDAWCRDAVAVCKYCSSVFSLWLLSAGRSIYRENIQPYCCVLCTSLPPLMATTGRGAYKAFPLPHLGASDHITVMLMPAYRPLVKVTKPVRKRIQVWPEGSSEALQDCFDTTDWSMFKQAATYNNTTDLQEYAETVTAYINKCTEDVTVTKIITVRANQKPWMTGEVYRLLKARNVVFRAGDEASLKTARANLSRGIREAKRQYSRGISHRFKDSRDTRSLWRGIQTITDYKPPPQTCDSNISLLNELNTFFGRIEVQNTTTAQKTPPPPGDQVMSLSPDSVRRSLSRINARKAPGPDNIPGRVLRDCAVELTDVNRHLQHNSQPGCRLDLFQSHHHHSGPKKSHLPPALMTTFAYRPNRSTDDAISTALHSALTHLDKKDSYVRMLFIDFSSAFNTIIPQQLTQKLVQLGLNTSLCNWLSDFLTGRPQAGCVLSPLLFTLLTHDCTPSHSSNLFIKFADDTTVVGLISKRDETDYRSEVSRLAEWCRDNNLSLNVEKTKEIIVDFRRAHSACSSDHQRCVCGESEQHQVPGCAHY